jgi:putative phosphoesterase
MIAVKIGILSDTHGNLSAAAKAARKLMIHGVSAVFHCGDIGGFDVLTELAAVFHPTSIPVHAVLGNVDVHSGEWKFFPAGCGVHIHGRFGEVMMEGHRIALLHGDDPVRFHQAVIAGEYALVLTGHTHEPHDYMIKTTRCINPGTAGRGNPDTCAVLDLVSGKLRILNC